ncbi:MAG: 3-oxoacyl-[acyl-carrier protein] reductase [Subtercola sp.]|nr:3-oxoacyl-[acyl-carrier protein] reductase [Subtercola sp.]
MAVDESTGGRLAGRAAIVTGASRGIGLAIVRRLVAEGAQVCMTARNAEQLGAAASTLDPDSVLPIVGKANDPVARAAVLAKVAERFGRLDILVNNVAISPAYGQLIDLDLEAARKIIDVNVLSTLAWTQAVWHDPALGFREHGGSVINISSVAGEVPSPGIGMYGVSKAAIAHLTRTLAAELGPDVRVNAVAPAIVKTQFARVLYEGREDEVAAMYPLKRLGTPEDVASTVAFLASPDASWITGQVVTLDGGLLSAGGRA